MGMSIISRILTNGWVVLVLAIFIMYTVGGLDWLFRGPMIIFIVLALITWRMLK